MLIWNTIRHLRPEQISCRVLQRLDRGSHHSSPALATRRRSGHWTEPVAKEPRMTGPEEFRFLNRTDAVRTREDWNRTSWSALWRYNLHYFDDLCARDAAERTSWHRALVQRWIAENPVATGTGWEPYPTSLRVVNWIKWCLGGVSPEQEWLDSLANQVRVLERRLEFHLLGNHLLANAKALMFAGLFFEGPESQRWWHRGRTILDQELAEQVLPDGGHFERSPMYHAIVLEDLIDLENLARAYGRTLSLGTVIAGMSRWLRVMSHPDGQISFFNDAAFGIAPTSDELDAYQLRLGMSPGGTPQDGLVHLEQSGYIRMQAGEAVLILDVAPIGPDYLPGHGHADTLSFELSVGAQRVLVNSGTSTYSPGAERMRQRGTVAHNTVSIDGQDSSEVWSAFRVARRAYPFGLEVSPGEMRVVCSHDGYSRLTPPAVHRRAWCLSPESLIVHDRVSNGRAVAHFHFHPEITVVSKQDDSTVLRLADHRLLVCRGYDTVAHGRYDHHEEFGRETEALCLDSLLEAGSSRVEFLWESSRSG